MLSFFFISWRKRCNSMMPYINDKCRPISDVPISNELFGNDCYKNIKELGDPTQIPIGAPSYPSFRYGRCGYNGGRLNFWRPDLRRGMAVVAAGHNRRLRYFFFNIKPLPYKTKLTLNVNCSFSDNTEICYIFRDSGPF